MASNKLTYSKSGVNIPKADSFVKFISSLARKSNKSGDFKNIGGFGAISPISRKLKDPHIVTSTDGVGTKIEIANDLNKFDTIGIDLVAMCVNDLVVQGAKPYLFLDYISISKINLKKLKHLVRGIVKGCDIAGCKLVGGETAEMPGTYTKGKFDIAGFAVGLVEKKKILNKRIRNNDLILAVPSNGLHSNGYSLVRYLLKKKKINFKVSKFLKDELIRPTKIYVKELSLINEKKLINGCANITGGGLVDNIQRIIPKNLCADIDLNSVKTLKIFRWLYKMGVSEKEMLKTFNCGVGFCLVTNPRNLDSLSKYFGKKFKPYIIGKIVKNSKKVKLSGKISW